MDKRKTYILSTLIIDILIVVGVVASLIWLFNGDEGVLRVPAASAIKYFTVESNILLAVVALINIPIDVLMLMGKRENAPKWALILFHMGEMSADITMLTVLFFLGPTMGYGFLYVAANSLMHLVNPLLGLIRYLFLSKYAERLDWKTSFFAALPMLFYGIFYIANLVSHNGYGTAEYDWYGFGAAGPAGAVVSAIIMVFADVAGSVAVFFARSGIAKAMDKGSKEKQVNS